MATSYNPRVVTNGLLLALDAANTKSFRGPPQTNVLTQLTYARSNVNNSTFKITNGSEVINVPRLGTRTVKYVDIYNDYNGGSGECCPSLFSYGDVSVSGNTVYTYSIVYRTGTGYSHPNYMYRYEYNGGTYVTEVGAHSTNNRTHLGDGWYHAWGTFTTQASTNRLITYLFHYEYATYNRVHVAAVQITQGSYIGAPEHMLEPGQVRGATVALGGGWADLSGNNNHGELVNSVTFNSLNNGSLVLDGVDDYVAVSNSQTLNPGSNSFSINSWLKQQSNATFNGLVEARGDNLHGFLCGVNYGGGYASMFLNTTNDVDQNVYTSTVATFGTAGVWMNVCIVVNRTSETIDFYLNGVKQGNSVSITSGGTANPGGGYRYWIGGDLGGPEANSAFAILQHYNRALTVSEILQNFNATRSRFGI